MKISSGTILKVLRNYCTKPPFRGENNLPLPEEYYLPLPPDVGRNYMANLKQEERVKRLQQFGTTLKTGKVQYKEEQLSMF
jgi:hypothetical protein